MPTYHKRNKVGILDLSIPVVNKKQKKTNKEIYNKNDNANMAESKNKSTKGKSISFLLGAGCAKRVSDRKSVKRKTIDLYG